MHANISSCLYQIKPGFNFISQNDWISPPLFVNYFNSAEYSASVFSNVDKVLTISSSFPLCCWLKSEIVILETSPWRLLLKRIIRAKLMRLKSIQSVALLWLALRISCASFPFVFKCSLSSFTSFVRGKSLTLFLFLSPMVLNACVDISSFQFISISLWNDADHLCLSSCFSLHYFSTFLLCMSNL